MKTLTILILTLTVYSCSKAPKKEQQPQGRQVFLTATINNTEVTATTTVLAIKTEVSGVTFYSLAAEDKTRGYNFMFFFKAFAKGAPDNVNNANQSFSIEHNKKGYIASKENLKFVITKENDNYLEGTFSFEAKERKENKTITVSNGKFKAKKQYK